MKVDIGGDEEVDKVEVVPTGKLKAGGLREQHLVLAWSLTRWNLPCGQEEVILPDPTLTYYYLQNLEHEADPEAAAVLKAMQKQVQAKGKFLCPIGSGAHWTLLVVDTRHEQPEVKYSQRA